MQDIINQQKLSRDKKQKLIWIIMALMISNIFFFLFMTLTSPEEENIFHIPAGHVYYKIDGKLKTKLLPYSDISLVANKGKLFTSRAIIIEKIPQEKDAFTMSPNRQESYLLLIAKKYISVLDTARDIEIYPPLDSPLNKKSITKKRRPYAINF